MIWPFLFDLLQVLYHSVLPVRVVLLNLFLDMLCISEGLVLPLGLMLTYAVYVLICLFYSQKFCVVQCLYPAECTLLDSWCDQGYAVHNKQTGSDSWFQ